MDRNDLALAAALVLSFSVSLSAQHDGDSDVDGDVDIADVASFSDCVTGPGVLPAVGCWVFDFDRDVDVDLADFGAMQRAFGAGPTTFQREMGIWQGTGVTPDGQGYPFRLTVAQWDYRIWGLGELFVNPGDPLTGTPAFHLAGSIHDGTMVLSMSGRLDNTCFSRSPDAYIATVEVDADAEGLSLVEVLDYLPVGCGRVVSSFEVSRSDAPHAAGNTDILGTWEGHMVTPAGWFYAPIPFWPPQESFAMSGETLMGFMQSGHGNPWVPMVLTWDARTQQVVYRWICSSAYSYKGVIDGNKFSGVFKWGFGETPDEEFHGVFAYTLKEDFVPPVPLIPGCN